MRSDGKHRSAFAGVLAILLAAAMFGGCGKSAESEFQKGVDAYYARDYAKAVEHYRIAADMDHAGAQVLLGRCYAEATGVPRDWDEAFRWWRKAAEQGHPDALMQMEALRSFEATRQAAGQGDAEAQYAIGSAYQFAENVNPDLSEAAKWYRSAAEQDHTGALYRLGHLYFDGSGVKEDKKKAFELWLRGAELEDTDAMIQLGECYEVGNGVPEDTSEAEKWFRLAIEHGSEYARECLDALLEAKKNLQAAEQGDPEAWLALGEYFFQRDSNEEAVKWYRRAAEWKDPSREAVPSVAAAQYQLGRCYEHGWGVEKDGAEAVKWYRLAAERGYDLARLQLSECYETGIGVAKDPAEAKKWKEMFLQANVPNVLYISGMELAKCGRPGDMEDAVRYWWRRAAEWKNPSLEAIPSVAAAQYQLGRCYYYGIVLEEDKAAGIEWHRKAAENGDPDAKKLLDSLKGAPPQ